MSLCRLSRWSLSRRRPPSSCSLWSSSLSSVSATSPIATGKQALRRQVCSGSQSLFGASVFSTPLGGFAVVSATGRLHTSATSSESRQTPERPSHHSSHPATAMSASTSTARQDASSSLRQRAVQAEALRTHSTKSGHSHDQDHHAHGLFGHSHSHSHSGDTQEAAALGAALSGASDRGSRIILLGLASNVFLTAAKGVGGYMLHSASLLADAGHSLSDLLGDVVVLFSWKVSRRPASRGFQYGYGKFEALGSLAVATALIGGALGIGVHSYFLFLHALSLAAVTAAPELAQAAETMLANSTSVIGGAGHHGHVHSLDPNAAWVALLSVLLKEWMYRATMKVAKEEGSNVLEANALHHRSDVFSGCLAGVAIIGSSLGFPMLDPVGGLLVAGMIIKQGSEIGLNAVKELVDYSLDPELTGQIEHFVLSMREDAAAAHTAEAHASTPGDSATDKIPHDHSHEHDHHHGHSSTLRLPIRSVSSVRTFKSGTFTLADMAIGFPADLTVADASRIADQIADSVKSQFPSIKEVVVRFDAEETIEREKAQQTHPH